jgi:hypothetical protein
MSIECHFGALSQPASGNRQRLAASLRKRRRRGGVIAPAPSNPGDEVMRFDTAQNYRQQDDESEADHGDASEQHCEIMIAAAQSI